MEAEATAWDHSEPKAREPVTDCGVRDPGSTPVLVPQPSGVTWEGQQGCNGEMSSWQAMTASYWRLEPALYPQFIPFWDISEQTLVRLQHRATPPFPPPLLLLQKGPLGMAMALGSPWLGLSSDLLGPATFPKPELTAIA